ncbi:MAG: hypothetical protein AAF984_09835 [Verrucomicrobiota bacterium]
MTKQILQNAFQDVMTEVQDDCSVDEFLYRIETRLAVEEGLEQIDNGEVISLEDVKKEWDLPRTK